MEVISTVMDVERRSFFWGFELTEYHSIMTLGISVNCDNMTWEFSAVVLVVSFQRPIVAEDLRVSAVEPPPVAKSV